MEDKWKDFTESATYRLVNIGRPAQFLLPLQKVSLGFSEDETVEENLHKFLCDEFGAFSTTNFPTAGFWRNDGNKIVYDECRQYEVSFLGKEKIPKLLNKLAEIAKLIEEDCLYFKAGQYTCLVYPI